VAASIAYGLGRPEEDSLILVFDLGGGTFDVSLVECFEGCLEVIDMDGDASLGGDDWDRCLMDWVVQQASISPARCAALPAVGLPCHQYL
jgi:molecular chaperone DnaK